jgi:class 3 adenylate cyclase
MDLMENLDPEEARAIVDPALKLMMDAVHRYGGYVAQFTGDGIFALFGAPLYIPPLCSTSDEGNTRARIRAAT